MTRQHVFTARSDPMTQIRLPQHEFCPAPFRRGLNRAEAADYIGIGTTKFDALVQDGRMPKPKRILRQPQIGEWLRVTQDQRGTCTL